MKTSKVLLSFALSVSLVLLHLLPAAAATEKYVIDGEHSGAVFKIKHLGIGNVHGRFNNLSGTLLMDSAKQSESQLKLSVMADRVDTDIRDRDAHLRSPDFLNACQFPTIELESRSVRQLASGDLEVAADLSLHGLRKPVGLLFRRIGAGKDMQGNSRVGYEAIFSLKRSDFGMAELLAIVGDTVEITISFEAVLTAAP